MADDKTRAGPLMPCFLGRHSTKSFAVRYAMIETYVPLSHVTIGYLYKESIVMRLGMSRLLGVSIL